MFLTVLLALSALAISSTAAYFSVVGLAVIFAASVIPIILMGGVVEFAKIVSVAWVHYHWHKVNIKLKAVMIFCIVVAMILTSVGVFGFLSKAHIQQTALGNESVAQVQRIKTEIIRQYSVIERGEIKIQVLEASGSNTDQTTQIQIDNEQSRMDSAALRLQPAIDEQNAIINSQTKLYREQIESINKDLNRLQNYIDGREITKAQQLIGEKSKGGWGPKTSETARIWRLERNNKKLELFSKIEDISQNNLAIIASRKEISRLRQAQEIQLAESNKLINRLRVKLGNIDLTNIDELIDEQYNRIKKANISIDLLTDEKYAMEAEFRKLEAEVGPIKYIAEFVYGEEATASLLERAVKWMIILLLLVLDPFAISLVIATTTGWKWHKEEIKRKKLGFNSSKSDSKSVIKLEDKLVTENERYNALMGTLETRNAEMNILREETQTLINESDEMNSSDKEVIEKLNTSLSDTEKIRDKLISELSDANIEIENFDQEILGLKQNAREELKEALENASDGGEDNRVLILQFLAERDVLQEERDILHEELEILQEEIEKVPVLEQQLFDANKEISNRRPTLINIQEAAGTEASLRHKIQILDNRITSMIELSDFDLKSAQELVEIKHQKLEVERRFEELLQKYDDLIET